MTRLRSYLALALAGTFWGFGFVFGKYALASMPVAAMVTYRFALAALLLLPILFFRRIRIAPADWIFFVAAAALFVPIQFLIQFEGLARTSVTHASLMVALVPALIALAALASPNGARGSAANWPAIAASIVGAALIVFRPAGNSTVYGDALVTVSLFAAVAWVLITERRLNGYDPVAASAVVLVLGAAMLVGFELVAHPGELIRPFGLAAWLATAGGAMFSTALSVVLWNVGLARVPASDAGVFVNIEPIVGALCGIMLFGDPAGWQLLVGSGLVLGAAVAVTFSSARAAHKRTATHATYTLSAPEVRSALAHARIVAPVVTTSSTNNTRRP